MTTSFESKPDQTDSSTQELPTIPKAKDMKKWNKRTVLDWIRKRHPDILEDDDVRIFEKARIGGRTFLAFTVENFQSYGLPLAVAVALKDLAGEVNEVAGEVNEVAGEVNEVAGEVNEEGKLSNQTAGKKRTGDEIDAPKPPNSPKRIRREDLLSKLATSTRERRKRIREIIREIDGSSDQHSDSIDPFPRAVDQLSDPTFERTIPFPFIGFATPIRFKSTNGNWQYMGRTKFKELIQALKELRKNDNRTTLRLYGTQGYGKSHLLAALVCYLAAQDERVVYIPDCRAWLEAPVRYMQAAMLFAWADDIPTQEEIKKLRTKEEINEFFDSQDDFIVFVDQTNGMKASNNSREEKERANLSEWLKGLASGRKKVYSSSANDMNYHDQASMENYNLVLGVYGGLDEPEMDQWWKRHSDIDLGGYKRSDVEGVTGCIPLLLDKCVVGKKIDLTVKDLYDIYDRAAGFAQQVKECDIPSRWKRYYHYVMAYFRHETIPIAREAHPDLIDHRYFYELDNNQGWYTCSLVRDAVGDQLLTWNEDFADADFLTSLPDFIDNRSVAGYMIEHAVLSSIRSNGLTIYAEIGKAMEVRLLRELSDIKTHITGTAVLYRPQKFNFRAIDGMIVLIKPDEKNAKKKLLMFPLQITLAPADHANSREQFFTEYGSWITGLSNFDVEVQFLWITPECRDSQEYPASLHPKWPEYLERYIPLQDVNQGIWEKYEDAQKKLLKTKAAHQKAAKKNKGSSIKAVPERAASERVVAKKAAAKKAKGGTS